MVSELPSLSHAKLSEPSIQLTAVPCTIHNILTTYPCLTTTLVSCQAVSLRVVSVRVKKSKVTNLISIVTLRPSLDYYYFLAIRSRYYIFSSSVWPPESQYWCQKSFVRPFSCQKTFLGPFSSLFFICNYFSAALIFFSWSGLGSISRSWTMFRSSTLFFPY